MLKRILVAIQKTYSKRKAQLDMRKKIPGTLLGATYNKLYADTIYARRDTKNDFSLTATNKNNIHLVVTRIGKVTVKTSLYSFKNRSGVFIHILLQTLGTLSDTTRYGYVMLIKGIASTTQTQSLSSRVKTADHSQFRGGSLLISYIVNTAKCY